MMSLRSFALAAALFVSATSVAQAASTQDAAKYIETVGNQAVATISDKSLDKAKKQTKLETLFGDSVDFKWVGRFVIGRYWRDASDAQKERYLTEYKKFLILHYTSRFTDYTSGSFKITGSKQDGEGEFTVGMQIQPGGSGGEPVLVDYRVRADGKNFKIFDVIVEGVSLIATQRSEFGAVLAKGGIDHLIEQLIAKSKLGAAAINETTAKH
jgi:phospholipid transport system substrate-binding protein